MKSPAINSFCLFSLSLIMVLVWACSSSKHTNNHSKILQEYLQQLKFEIPEGDCLIVIIPQSYCGGCVSIFLQQIESRVEMLKKMNIVMITVGNVLVPLIIQPIITSITDEKGLMNSYDLQLQSVNLNYYCDRQMILSRSFSSNNIDSVGIYLDEIIKINSQ